MTIISFLSFQAKPFCVNRHVISRSTTETHPFMFTTLGISGLLDVMIVAIAGISHLTVSSAATPVLSRLHCTRRMPETSIDIPTAILKVTAITSTRETLEWKYGLVRVSVLVNRWEMHIPDLLHCQGSSLKRCHHMQPTSKHVLNHAIIER